MSAAATAPKPRVRRSPARKTSARGRLKVVRRNPSGRSLRLVGLVAFVVIFGGLLALAALHSLLVQGQNRLDELEERIDAETERSQQLRVVLGQLESPDRILAEAHGRLGMVTPPARVYLQSSGLGDPRHPVPPPGINPFGPEAP